MIHKIHVENFRSLVNFNLDIPHPYMCLVGENNVGKSNIITALKWLFDPGSMNMIGIPSVDLSRTLTSLAIKISIDVTPLDGNTPSLVQGYPILNEEGQIRVSRLFSFRGRSIPQAGVPSYTIECDYGTLTHSSVWTRIQSGYAWMPFPDIENCFPRLVHIRPADIGRRVDDGTPESRLASLKWTNDLTSDDIAWVVAQLRNVLPSAQGFSDVSLVLHEESQSFGFWDQYGYIVPLRKAGSGVIQITYTLLRIALARRRISNAGTDSRTLLLAIDEPEQHLASGLQKAYARLLKLLSADHQIIVTSHSHLFLERGVDGATVVLQRGHRNGTVARPQKLCEKCPGRVN